MIEFDIRADDLRQAIAKLTEVEPRTTIDLRNELKSTATQMATMIAANISAIKPLSGMTRQTAHALTWSSVKAIASYAIKGDRRRDVTSLLSIKVSSKTPGYIVSEFAGNPNARPRTSSQDRTRWGGSKPGGPQGAHLIAHMVQKFGPLKGKGGNRIAWKMFMRQQTTLHDAAVKVLDKFMAKISDEMGS